MKNDGERLGDEGNARRDEEEGRACIETEVTSSSPIVIVKTGSSRQWHEQNALALFGDCRLRLCVVVWETFQAQLSVTRITHSRASDDKLGFVYFIGFENNATTTMQHICRMLFGHRLEHKWMATTL